MDQDKRITEFDTVSLPLVGNETFAIVQGSETKKIPSNELKDFSADHYKGFYNILTNSPAISNATGVFGNYYRMTDAGTRDFGSGAITVGEDDILAFDGSVWYKKTNNNQNSLFVTTVKNITSSDLATQTISGLVTYINALPVSFSVGVNEDVIFNVTNTGQVFRLLLRNRAFGGSEPDIVDTDILEITPIDDLYRRWYSYQANNAGGVILTNTPNTATISGTASVVARGGTTFYNSLIMNNYASSSANGSNAGIRNANASDGSYLEGVDAFFVFANNDTNTNACTAVGLYSFTSAIPNSDPSGFTANTILVANDSGDTNLSFIINRTATTSSFIKISCGADFPAHTTTDAYLFRVQIPRTVNQSERYAILTIRNIVTGKVFSQTLTGAQIPSGSDVYLLMVNRGNRNTGVSTSIRMSQMKGISKLY